jgi:hypothetical protein
LIFFALFKTKSNIGAGLFYSFFINQDHVSRFVEWIGFQGFYWIIWFNGFTVILDLITEFKSHLKNLIVRIDNSFSILYIMILLFTCISYMSEIGDSHKATTLPIKAKTTRNHLVDDSVVRDWDQEIYSSYDLKFEPCCC